jgi:uncharacterized protein (DUF4415 family)
MAKRDARDVSLRRPRRDRLAAKAGADSWVGVRVTTPPKSKISVRIDRDVLDWFRGFPRYQTVMNKVLRTYFEHHARKGGR